MLNSYNSFNSYTPALAGRQEGEPAGPYWTSSCSGDRAAPFLQLHTIQKAF